MAPARTGALPARQLRGRGGETLRGKNRRLCETDSANTFADGLATRVAFAMPFKIIQRGLDEMVLVSEEAMRQAVVRLLHTTHNLAEGAGAAGGGRAARGGDFRRAGVALGVGAPGARVGLRARRRCRRAASGTRAGARGGAARQAGRRSAGGIGVWGV